MEDDTKICPYCGNRIKAIAKKCRYCKSWLHEEEQENNEYSKSEDFKGCFKDFMGCLGSLLGLGIIIVVFIVIRNIPEDFWQNLAQEVYSSANLSCDSDVVKDLVIQAFKENDSYYKTHIDAISDVTLEYPVATSYDASISKYSCKGKINVLHFQRDYDFNCDIVYSAQKVSEGIYIETTTCDLQNAWKTLLNWMY